MTDNDNEDDAIRLDLEHYMEQLAATDPANVHQLAMVLATKLWTIEKKLNGISCSIDNLIERIDSNDIRF